MGVVIKKEIDETEEELSTAPDSHIDSAASIKYWNSISPDVGFGVAQTQG